MTQTTEAKTNEREAAIDSQIAVSYRALVAAEAAAQTMLESLMSSAAWTSRSRVRRTNSKSTYRTYIVIDGELCRATFPALMPFVDEAKRERANKVLADLASAGDAYDAAEAAYEGWSRFFLVPAGHIHSSMDCSSCNRGRTSTAFSWLPELSGLTEADAVAAHGSHLCTVCFPTAPVEWHHTKGAK